MRWKGNYETYFAKGYINTCAKIGKCIFTASRENFHKCNMKMGHNNMKILNE